MTEPPTRVTAVIRHRGTVLACHGTGENLGLPTRPADERDSAGTALDTLLADLHLAGAVVERWGESVEAAEGPLRPVLVAADGRDVRAMPDCRGPAWVAPADLRDDNDRWWRAYQTVAPSAETVRSDTERGSTAISTDALWVLRDAAVEAESSGGELGAVERAALELVEARPGMAALATRVDRAMADAASSAEVVNAATAGLGRAAEADAAASSLAAETVEGRRVLTLSRSGTVRTALLESRPPVVVSASRPGGEGETVATELEAAGLDVERCADADVYARLRAGDVDTVLVGADAVTPVGGVVNKVGTWALALAACWVDVPTLVVCASDKVRAAGHPAPWRPLDPLFDLTPAPFATAVLTERGRLDADGVRAVAAEHRELAAWRR